jgi:hypothetical protein
MWYVCNHLFVADYKKAFGDRRKCVWIRPIVDGNLGKTSVARLGRFNLVLFWTSMTGIRLRGEKFL